MLSPTHFTSHEDIFYSLRCSDSKCSASSSRRHSLALESKSQEGWQEALLCKGISRVSPPPPQTGACQEFTHHLYHKAELVFPLQTGPASACVSLLNLPITSSLLQLKTEHLILSNFQVHHKLPQDAQSSFSTPRNVPVTLSHILPWERSQQRGEGVPWCCWCHATSYISYTQTASSTGINWRKVKCLKEIKFNSAH